MEASIVRKQSMSQMRKGSLILSLFAASLYMSRCDGRRVIDVSQEPELYAHDIKEAGGSLARAFEQEHGRNLQEYIVSDGVFETSSGLECIYYCILEKRNFCPGIDG